MASSSLRQAAVGGIINVAAYRECRYCFPYRLPGIRVSYGSRGHPRLAADARLLPSLLYAYQSAAAIQHQARLLLSLTNIA